MANISILSRLVNGAQKNVDLSTNTLVVGALSTGTNTLTDTILGRLIHTQDGSDLGVGYHTHDGVYTRTTALASSTGGTSGSTLIGDDASYAHFTPAAATVKGALSGIDAALAVVAGGAANQTLSNLTSPTSINQDLIPSANNTRTFGTSVLVWKQIWANKVLAPSALAIDFAGQAIYNGAGAVVIDALNYKLQDASSVGSVNWNSRLLLDSAGATQLAWSTTGIQLSANLDMNTHKVVNVVDPSSAQDAATKNYTDTTFIPLSQKGASSGVATLDSGGKVPLSQLPASLLEYKGQWNANTNTPTLSNTAGSPVAGYVWEVSVAGSTDFGAGPITFAVGDWAIFNGTVWEKSVNSNSVVSVNGATGAVTINAINQLTGDVTASAATGSQSKASLIASIQGTAVSGTTGTGNVVFSNTPTFTGAITAASAIFSGAISASNLSGTNTGDQTITLTGDVTGSGTGSFAATIGAGRVTAAKLATVTDGVTLDQAGAGATLEVKAAGISATQIATGIADQKTIVGGAGTALSVAQAPLSKRTMVAGQAFTAGTTYVVRWALNGETAGTVYAADRDATSVNKYAGIGLALSAAGVTAGGNIDVVMLGEYSLGSADTLFNSTDIGKELFVGTAGALILGASLAGTTGEAAFCIGVIQTTGKVWVDQKTLRGIS